MENKSRKNTGTSVRAAINQIKIDSLPSFYFTGKASIFPYGSDNLYPDRILNAISKSPTSKGCVKREAEFIFGQGLKTGGDTVVNRYGETLNDIIRQCCFHGYSPLRGFGVHVNFNALGEICELFFVSYEYMRKHRNLQFVEYGVYSQGQNSVFANQNNVTVPIYKKDTVLHYMEKAGGVLKFNGAVVLYSGDLDIYPISPLDSASISSCFEYEAQIYPYANIKNGFSGNTIVKIPTLSSGDNEDDDDSPSARVAEKIKSVHGSDQAGSSIVVEVPQSVDGKTQPFQMVEHLSPTNVDDLFENQNDQAERNILKCYTMPMILLGVSSKGAGMFNEASFADAFNYKNADTESDRQEIERFFNKILEDSCFGVSDIQIEPLRMKQKEGGNTNAIGEKQGGKLLENPKSKTEEEALDLLGNPQKIEEENKTE